MNPFRYYLYQKQFAPSTIHEAERSVRQFTQFLKDEHIPLKQCTYSDILAYITHLQNMNCKPSYINQMIRHIGHYFQFHIKEKHLKVNPCNKLQIKGQIRHKVILPLKDEELTQLYLDYQNKVPYSKQDIKQRDCIILALLVFQAIQPQELEQLRVTDINLTEGSILIPETKRSNVRILPLHASQILLIADFIRDKPDGKMIQGKLKDILYRIFDNAGRYCKPEITYRLVRDSRIILWLKQYHIRQVQYFAGMKYISSLKKYQQQLTEGLRDKVDQYHPL